MSLLKEFANGDLQQDLKTADGSSAGKNDLTSKPVDVKFNLMRNMINTNGSITGSTVNDYLERAHDLNDEVDTVGFAIETDNGDLIKVYVNAQQADEFEEECSKLLGLDDDSESAINTLAQKFDIIDVVWPQDPNASLQGDDESEDPYDSVSIDDDLSSFMDDDSVDSVDTQNSDDNADDFENALPADDDHDDQDDEPNDDEPKKKSLMKDIAGGSEESSEEDEEEHSEEDEDGEKKKKEPKASAEGDEEESSEESTEELSDEEGSTEEEPELDADGNPIKKEKKAKKKEGEKEVTEEGLLLKNLSNLVESLRDDVNAHIDNELAKRANKSGKFVIDCLMTGGTLGRRQYLYQEEGDVKYFDTMEEAESIAKSLTAKRNHTMARAHYTFTPRMVEDIDLTNQEEDMIGSKFLQRVTEASEPSTIKDTVWNGIHNRMKRPYDKKIVEFFSLLDIPGRYVRGEEGLEDAIRAGGDIIRRAGRKQTSFNTLFDLLKGGSSSTVSEAKKGSRLQKILETVMVKLGFPASLVSSNDMPGPLNSMLRKAAARMEANADMEAALISLAKSMGLTTADLNEGKAFKVREPGWYVVDHMDKPVDGPYSEGNAKKEAKEMSKEYAAKHGKGDMPAFDAIYFSDYDIKRANESTLGSRFKQRVLGEDKSPEYWKNILKKADKLSADEMKDKEYIADRIVVHADMSDEPMTRKQALQIAAKICEDIDVGQDDFMESVMALVLALGIPEGILQPRRAMIIKALRDKKQTLTNRGMLQQRMQQLIDLIHKGTKVQPSTGTVEESLNDARQSLTESALFEAFGPLEAVVGKSLEMFNAEEPAAGPAMMAGYEGSGSHEETVLVLAVDPDADDDNKSLRVGIDSPWDGGIHAKYFPNNKEGYKAAVDYANMLRTCNLKKGGRPKGWKDSAPSVSRMSDDMREDPMQRGRNAAEMGRGPSAKDFE